MKYKLDMLIIKIIHMRLFIPLIISFLSLVYVTNAQETTETKETTETTGKKERKRTCRIVFPERPNNAAKMAFLFDGKSSQEVYLSSMNFSPVISLSAGDITLFMSANSITDLENIPQDTPRLNIPKEIDDFYIIMTPDPANKTLPLKMTMVSITTGKLKKGETLWFNTTGHHIVAKLGQSKMSVAPKSQTVTKKPMLTSGYYAAEFGYHANGKEPLARITEQMWWHDEKSRHLGFIVNSGGKLPKIYFFRDFRDSSE